MATLTTGCPPPLFPHDDRSPKWDLLAPLRHWLDGLEIKNDRCAHWVCRLIPCSCPFERNVTLFGHTYHIPALCKINPVYNEFIALRFRALTYLTEVAGEDISQYLS